MIPSDTTARFLAILHLVLIVILWILPVVAYDSLPDQVPVHFNFAGEADRWQSKSGLTLWMMPIIWTVFGMLALVVLRFPKAYNFPRKDELLKLPDQFQQPVHEFNRRYLLAIFVLISAMFVYIQYSVIESARAGTSTLNMVWLFSPVAGILLLTVLFLVHVRSRVDEAVMAARRAGTIT